MGLYDLLVEELEIVLHLNVLFRNELYPLMRCPFLRLLLLVAQCLRRTDINALAAVDAGVIVDGEGTHLPGVNMGYGINRAGLLAHETVYTHLLI